MIFEVELNGKTRTVALERDPAAEGRFRVALDGALVIVDARRAGTYGLSMLFPDESHESGVVHFAPGPSPGELLGVVGGRTLAVTVNGRRSRRGDTDARGAEHGEQRIAAPMPGRVVRVLVAPGDTVQVRQPVIVVEAMKMENELRSPKAGRVKDVAVAAGTAVEAGRVLVVIE